MLSWTVARGRYVGDENATGGKRFGQACGGVRCEEGVSARGCDGGAGEAPGLVSRGFGCFEGVDYCVI